jgi:hypothetical protein
VVAWKEECLDDRGYHVSTVALYRVLSSEGLALTPPLGLGTSLEGPPPDVMWDGEAFGIVWVEGDGPIEEGRLYLARLSAGGEMLGPPRALVAPPPPAGPVGPPPWYAVAFGHGTFVLASAFAMSSPSLWRWDRNGTFVERVDAAAESWVAGGTAVGVASDPTGFGVLVDKHDMATSESVPVFFHFDVVP